MQDTSTTAFLQLLRLSATGPYHKGTRTVFLYEDVHGAYRMGLLLQDWKLAYPLHYHVAFGYRKDESGDAFNQWLLFTGMNLTL